MWSFLACDWLAKLTDLGGCSEEQHMVSGGKVARGLDRQNRQHRLQGRIEAKTPALLSQPRRILSTLTTIHFLLQRCLIAAMEDSSGFEPRARRSMTTRVFQRLGLSKTSRSIPDEAVRGKPLRQGHLGAKIRYAKLE